MTPTSTIESWAGNPVELGPLYPWLGSEVALFLVSLALWLCWMVWYIKTEGDAYSQEAQSLKQHNVNEVVGEE